MSHSVSVRWHRHLPGHASQERYTVSTVKGQELNLHKPPLQWASNPRPPVWQALTLPLHYHSLQATTNYQTHTVKAACSVLSALLLPSQLPKSWESIVQTQLILGFLNAKNGSADATAPATGITSIPKVESVTSDMFISKLQNCISVREYCTLFSQEGGARGSCYCQSPTQPPACQVTVGRSVCDSPAGSPCISTQWSIRLSVQVSSPQRQTL